VGKPSLTGIFFILKIYVIFEIESIFRKDNKMIPPIVGKLICPFGCKGIEIYIVRGSDVDINQSSSGYFCSNCHAKMELESYTSLPIEENPYIHY